MELFRPLKAPSPAGNKYNMAIMDAVSKYTKLVPIQNQEATTIARSFFEKWICHFGVQAVIVSDRGNEFLNKVMADMTKHLGTKHSATSAFHPQTSESAERYNRTMIG